MEDAGSRDKDKRVLLVDDDPVVLDILATGLGNAGYGVDACAEAQSALARYRKHPPDIAVLDIGLPDMSGTDLARELLRCEYRPILILSNYNDEDIVRRAIMSGVVGYLVKPLSVGQLVPSLETSLTRHRQRCSRVASHLDTDGVSNEQLERALDSFPFALLIVDRHHHPIYRNAPARALLHEGVLQIDPAGRLRSPLDRDGLVPVLDGALGKPANDCAGAALLDSGTQPPRHAWAAPLGDTTETDGDALAALVVFDAAAGRRYPWQAMKALYGLTRKETDLVNGLLQGQTLEDYCAANFVTANTARTHLKSIYRKTGVNRQSEIVRRFASMFVPGGD